MECDNMKKYIFCIALNTSYLLSYNNRLRAPFPIYSRRYNTPGIPSPFTTRVQSFYLRVLKRVFIPWDTYR